MTLGGKRQIVQYHPTGVLAVDPEDGKILWELPHGPEQNGVTIVTPVQLDADTLLLAAGLCGGTTIGIWAITLVGEFAFAGGIPAIRLPWYISAGLIGIAVSGYLSTRYMVQKHRRDAWWDGFAASDEPSAEVIYLKDVKGFEGSDRVLRFASPN